MSIYRKIRIYQPEHESESFLEPYEANKGIKSSDYTLVYEGLIKDTTDKAEAYRLKPYWEYLENIFGLFNSNPPVIHKGRSMSVGDILVVDDKHTYYCQPIGFEEIKDFEPEKAKKLEDTMDVVYVEPGKPAYKTFIGSDLESMQVAVDGYIEPVGLDEGVLIVGNEEAKIRGMQGNRQIDGIGIMAGPFFIAADGEENIEGLSEEQIQKYVERFSEPEDISDDEVQDDLGFAVYGFEDFLAALGI